MSHSAPAVKLPEPRDPKISSVAPGELIVRYKPGREAEGKAKIARKVKGTARDMIRPGARKGRALAGIESTQIIKLEEGENFIAAKEAIAAEPEVLYVEPNYTTRLFAAPAPNDFDFESLYGLRNTGANGGREGADIKAPEAWEITTGSREIVVAVIDTGIDYFHEDLRGNIWRNLGEIAGNGIDDDNNGYIDDIHGYDFISQDSDPTDDHFHGTHVAGTIGAIGNNGLGVIGVSPVTRMIAVKAFNDRGGGTVAGAAAAIHYAIQNGARIINASWGLEDRSRTLQGAILAAKEAGVLVVAAAGNSRTDAPFYPAAYPSVMAVSSTNNKDERSNFSNHGQHIDIAAPGEQILSTVIDSRYEFISGTSMASPHVTGAAALVLARHPDFTAEEVFDILRNTTDPISTGEYYLGRGRLNALRAVSVEKPLPFARLDLPKVIAGRVDLRGSANGKSFSAYTLFYGEGARPASWIEIHTASAPVDNGVLLAGFDSTGLNDGEHTFRIAAANADGLVAEDFVTLQVKNVQVIAPYSLDIFRAGDLLRITGTVLGQGRKYGISWAWGLNPSDWRTDGIAQPSNGEVREDVLATFDTTFAPTNEFVTMRLSATNSLGAVQEHRANFLWFDGRLKPGYPLYIPTENEFPSGDYRQVKVADLNGDDLKEIVIVDHGNSEGKVARLNVYRHDGTILWGKELNGDAPYSDVPTIGDVDGDGFMEIFVDVGSVFYAFRHDGAVLPGAWPLALSHRGLGKALGDIDGDGQLEIAAFANLEPEGAAAASRSLTVYNAQGVILNRWTLPACNATNVTQRLFPVIANMDEDDEQEIVCVSSCDNVALFDMSKPSEWVWSQGMVGLIVSSPIVADFDGDRSNDVLIATTASSRGASAGLFMFHGDGRVHQGWPTLTEESFPSAPAVGDLNGDGSLEIVAQTVRWKLHVIEADGFPVRGWPADIDFASTYGYPLIGDITGDGRPEVMYYAPGYTSIATLEDKPSYLGGLRAWTAAGAPISLNPGRPYPSIPNEGYEYQPYFAAGSPIITDLDDNGLIDLVGSSIRDWSFFPLGQPLTWKNRSSIYAWEIPVAFNPLTQQWADFRLNPANNAHVPSGDARPLPPEMLPIADQIIAPEMLFHPIALDQYLSWPGLPIQGLNWSASGEIELAVDIDAENVARVDLANPLFTGVEPITFSVTDGATFTRSITVRFEVRPGYLPPLAVNDVAQTTEEGAITIDLLANDTNPAPGPLTLVSVSRPSRGSVEILGDGRVRYTPNPNYAGLDNFSYVVRNDAGAQAIGSAFITIVNINDIPALVDDRALTFEDRPVTINALQNDIDADGDLLQMLAFTQPAHGSVTFTEQRQFVYVPRAGFIGEDSFTYTVTDGSSPPQTARVTVLVRALNNPPVAFAQRLTMNRNTTLDIIYRGEDPEGASLTFRIIRAPQHAELFSYPAVGQYIPRRDYSGTDSFSYRASDGVHESAEAFVDITITATNNPPVALSASFVTRIGQSLPLTLTANDPDQEELTFRLVTMPSHGMLEGEGTNYIYRPNPGYHGRDEFRFSVSDGQMESPPATISLETTDRNTAPAANPKLVRALPDAPTSFVIAGVDAESNPLTYELVSQPMHGTLTGSAPQLVYRPSDGYVGPDRFRFRVSDGEFWSAPAAVTILVAEPNTLPAATNQVVEFYGAGPVRLELNVRDSDGHPIECVILRGPRGGRVYGAGTTFFYVPGPNFTGVDIFTYKPHDGRAFGNEGTVRLQRSLLPPPQPPGFEETRVLATGDFELTLTNEIGRSFRIEASTNFTNWDIVTNLPGSSGRFLYQAPATNAHHFYRAIAQ